MAKAPDNLDPAIRAAIANQPSMGGTVRGENLDPAIKNAIANQSSITNGKVGTVSEVSGLVITGNQRNKKKEAEAIAVGYTKEYIDSRGGINSQGYFNDTPLSGQLTAAEQRQVTKPDGTVNTQAMANILMRKQYDEAIASGQTPQMARSRLQSQWGTLFNLSALPAIPAGEQVFETRVTTPSVTATPSINMGGGMDYGSLTSVFTQTPTDAAAPTGAALATMTTPATTAEATNAAGLTPGRQSIFDVINDRLSQYGLGSLSAKVKQLIIDGATEDTITIQLQETPEYQRRFKANQERIKKGLTVLTPAEYLNVEDSYRQILRAYGLNQFDTDDYVSQFIANDVSAAELSGRVVAAVQRVRNADPAVSKTLKDYYGIGENDMVAYVLDPNQQLPKIERQIAAAEIGTAARRQGLEAGVSVAEQLAAQGISAAEAQKGYATIADILPTAEKLSDIYQGVEDQYRQAEAEQEVFNTLASAQRKRQRLIGREVAAFSGESGLGRTSLTQQSGGQF
jgi:hypothetical protein